MSFYAAIARTYRCDRKSAVRAAYASGAYTLKVFGDPFIRAIS